MMEEKVPTAARTEVTCTISGSFRKFFKEIVEAKATFEKAGIRVLFPVGNEIASHKGEFAILDSDKKISKNLNPKEIEDERLRLLAKGDFLYLYNPAGYVGNSALLELGFAIALGKPIYALEPVRDALIGTYISEVISPSDLAERLTGR